MRILGLLLFFLFFSSCSSKHKVIQNAKNEIKTLASDEFHGRGYTHHGLQKTEDYLAKRFQDLGLIPVYPNYRQKVEYPVNIIHTTDLKINGQTQIFGWDYLVGPNSETDKISSTTFNIPDNLFDFSLEDGRETFKLLSLNQGKIPVLDFRNATDSLKQRMFSFSNYLDQEKNHYNLPAIVHLHDELIHGASNHQDNFIHIFLNQDLPKESLIELSVSADFKDKFLSHNIVGKIKGIENDSSIFILAHFDHLGQVNETIFPGANDNASGVAMLLSLASYFKKNPPKRDIYFYAMTGEEAGLKGSLTAVENLPIPKENIRFVLNLDLVGTGENGIQVVNSRIFQDEFNLMLNINHYEDLLKQIKTRGEACNSDHCPFHYLGIPSFSAYTLGGVSHYHNPLDKPETLTLDEFYDLYILFTQFIEKL